MIPKNNKSLLPYARELRKNMTKEEKHLWYDFLKKLPCSVYRQHNIENYIVDFYIAEKKVVIEVDGSQHLTRDNMAKDETRDYILSTWGIKVLRYSNESINRDFHTVVNDILMHLEIKASECSW